jgi:hypothetical protein
MSTTVKTKNKENEIISEESSGEDFPGIEDISSSQAKIAARLAASVAPVIAKELMGGKITFAALTVIVDDKYSGTFPFYPVLPSNASEQEKYLARISNSKINMLSAVEFAKTAGVYKQKSFRSFEEGFFDPPQQT